MWRSGSHFLLVSFTHVPYHAPQREFFRKSGNRKSGALRRKSRAMNKLGANLSGPAVAGSNGMLSAEETLGRAFHDFRDELVSTLMFLLGNREDAQDAAQDAFLKCWRNRATLGEIQNLRAWIFRVGLNTAKDMQRSAWARRAKPMVGEEI